MNINDIKNFRSTTARLIAEGSLHEAFSTMRSFSEGGMSWEVTSAIDRLEQNYAYMLRYMVQGIDDPGRGAIYDGIVDEARAIADILARSAYMRENPTLYYNTLRSLNLRRAETISGLLAQYKVELQRLDMDFDNIGDPQRTRAAEQLLSDFFNRVWVTHPLSTEDIAAIKSILLSQNLPLHGRCAVVSALTLGVLEFYDVRRLELLLQVYIEDAEPEVAIRALVGFVVAMFRYRRRSVPRSLMDTLAAAKEKPEWQPDLKAATIECMRTRDTDRLSSKLRNEILPKFSQMPQELKDKLGESHIDMQSLMEGGNPEWDALLSNSGIGETLREMSEIQAEGGDIYMSSFSNLKHFPFFNDVANWFLPFYGTHSAVASADNYEGTLSNTLNRLPFLCDSDKYSVMLSLGSVPAAQLNTLTQAMEAQEAQFHDMLSEIDKADKMTRRKGMVNNYVRNLYRFYRLFRRKGEFFNPFAHNINLLEVESLADGFSDTETLTVIAEFCVKHRFWNEACSLLKKIDSISEPDGARAQKIAFCLDNMGEYAQAISHYEEAEMLGDAGAWLLGRMARTFRRLGKPLRAIDYYKRLLELTPDDVPFIVELGNTLLEANKPDEAEPHYFKAIYLAPESASARRGLAWSQFLNKKFDAADASYAQLLKDEENIIDEDLLNAGHTARARGEIGRAIGLYRRYADRREGGVDVLRKALASDSRWLPDAEYNNLIVEALLYSIDN